METEELIIPIDAELQRFQEYLSYNDRVIFSARFGDGKTFFLDNFFENHKDKYYCITVYPVNYQVEENKDIFELIKKDILIQLFANDSIVDDGITIDDSLFTQYYLLNNGGDIILDLLSCIPQIETPVKIVQKAIEHLMKFTENRQDIQESTQDKIQKYLQTFSQAKGICEFDSYSELITKCITHIKEKEHKEVILIVEDLDRIDPAHIFRILNILTAHIDRYYTLPDETDCNQLNNKFNFDKILTVCHYENIEKIFHHLYGEGTDFDGYIQKFTTSNVFKYSLENLLSNYLFSQIKDADIIANRPYFEQILKTVLQKNKKPNLRKIIHSFNCRFSEITAPNFKGTKLSTENPFIKLIIIALRFECDFDQLIDSILSKSLETNPFCFFIHTNWHLLADKGGKICFQNGGTIEFRIEPNSPETYSVLVCNKPGELALPRQELRGKAVALKDKCMEYINH